MTTNFKISTNDLSDLYITSDHLTPETLENALEDNVDSIPGMTTYSYVGNIIVNQAIEPTWLDERGLITDQDLSLSEDHGVYARANGEVVGWGVNTSSQVTQTVDVPYIPLHLGHNDIAQVETDGSTSTFLKLDGTIWTCGANLSGQLGDGTAVNKSSPIQVGTLSNWKFIAMGLNKTHAIDGTGKLWAWGYNINGQLGVNLSANGISSPTQVGTVADWKTVSSSKTTSGYFGVAIRNNGTMWAWGNNTSGYLGLNRVDAGAISSPVQIGTLSDWKSIRVSSTASYAIKTDGTGWSWGANGAGNLGVGDTVTRSSPTLILGSGSWKDLAIGIGVKTDGTLWGWGNGTMVGDGTTIDKSTPVQVGTLTNWDKVHYTQQGAKFAIKTDNTLWSWGYNTDNILGDGLSVTRSSPVQVGTSLWSSLHDGQDMVMMGIDIYNDVWGWGNQPVEYPFGVVFDANYDTKVSIGSTSLSIANAEMASSRIHALLIDDNGDMYGWGDGASGKLGHGSQSDLYKPTKINSKKWSKVSTSYASSSFGITTDGTLWSWGYNSVGQLGDGTKTTHSSPVQVGALNDWSKLAQISANTTPGDSMGGAIKTDGTLWTWGRNDSGQLGLGDTINRSSPVQVGTMTNWNSVASGTLCSGGIKTDGSLWSWGYNANGNLGLNHTTNVSTPVQVGTLTNWSKLIVTAGNSWAIKTDGTLWSWGNISNGALGDGTSVSKSSPIQIGSHTDWTDIQGDHLNVLVLKSNKTLWYWGNAFDTNLPIVSSPTQIGSQIKWNQIYTNRTARDMYNNVWFWGENEVGQLGVGATSAADKTFAKTINNASIKQVALGSSSTYILDSDGHLFAFGDNNHGRLGTNSTTDTPNYWVPAAYEVEKVAPQDSSCIILKRDGTFASFGKSDEGQLGLGDPIDRSSPTQLSVPAGNWSKIGTGHNHVMVIKKDGTLWALGGSGGFGKLGLGDTINRSSPVQVGTLSNWVEVNSGITATIALRADNTLWTWGRGNIGQLGDGTTTSRSSPVQIAGAWNKISGGLSNDTFLATKTDGTLWSWGNNASGQLGVGNTLNHSTPTQVGTMTNWATLAGGNGHSGGITTTGQLWVWGNNGSGRLGLGHALGVSTPVQVGTLTNWSKIALGAAAMLAIKTNGTLWAWGAARKGVTGLGNVTTYSSPMQIGSLNNWDTVAISSDMSFATKTDGTLWGWGEGGYANMIDGTNINYSSPVQVGTKNNWTSVVMSYYDTAYALDNTDNLYVWGGSTRSTDIQQAGYYGALGLGKGGVYTVKYPTLLNNDVGCIADIHGGGFCSHLLRYDGVRKSTGANANGQLGIGSINNTYEFVDRNYYVTGTSSSGINADGHILLIKADGTLWAAGAQSAGIDEATGQLGVGDTVPRNSPVQVGTMPDWKSLDSGYATSVGIKTDGSLWSWGYNSLGQLGIESTIDKSTPVQVGTLTNWKFITVGPYNILAIKTDGSLWSWGEGANGINAQPSTGATINRSSPVQIGTMTNWRQVSCGSDHAAAVKTDNTIWTWGLNSSGQLGDAFTNARSSPFMITGTDWKQVSAGIAHTGAVTNAGGLYVWGAGASGQIGNGITINKSTPVQVGTLTNWTWVEASSDMCAATNSIGHTYTWGLNTYGYLGLGDTLNRSSPVLLNANYWTPLSMRRNSMAKDRDNNVWVWGFNGSRYALGLGDTVHRSSPVILGGAYTPLRAKSIALANSSGGLIDINGALWTWGDNSKSQLGISAVGDRSSPVQVGTLTDWKSIEWGTKSAYAIKINGTLWSWGNNARGELGLGDTVNRNSPVQVGTINNYHNVIPLKFGAILERYN